MTSEPHNRRATDNARVIDPSLNVLQAQIHEIGNVVSRIQAQTNHIDKESTKSGVEKYAPTLLGSLILAAIIGMTSIVFDTSQQLTRMSSNTESQERAISEIKTQIAEAIRNNYTRNDAVRDMQTVVGEIAELKKQFNGYEERLRHIEREYDKILGQHRALFKETHTGMEKK